MAGVDVGRLELSRAVRVDLRQRLEDASLVRVSYAIPEGLFVETADVDAARSIVCDVVGFLFDEVIMADGALLTAHEPAAEGDPTLLMATGQLRIDVSDPRSRFAPIAERARAIGADAHLTITRGDRVEVNLLLRLPSSMPRRRN